jgi:hypothetical protein
MLRGFYLTLFMGPTVALPAPQPVMDALQSAQVTTAAGSASGFQLTFALSKKSILNTIMLPAGAFDPGIRVILVATVNSLPTVLIDGIITQHTLTPSNDPGQSTLSVTGEDLTVLMNLDDKEVEYPGLPVEGIIGVILLNYETYGIIPLLIPPIEIDIEGPLDKWYSQTGTDLNYINTLASECGYVFYIDPGPVPGANVAYFGPEIRVGIPQSALNINMDAETNIESLSFTFDGMATKRPVITVFDPITGSIPISIPIPDVSLLRPPLALRPAAALRTVDFDEVANLDPIQAALVGLAEAAKPDAITGSGQLDVLRYGRPLKARQLVGVRGAGPAYDGLYYVSSVTHSIKRGEYKQSFNLGREGLISLTPVVVP